MATSNVLLDETAAVFPEARDLTGDSSLLTALLEHSTARIYFKDLESRFVRINPYKARMLGLSGPDEAIGKTDEDFFNPDYARERRGDELEVIRSGVPIVDKVEREEWPDGRVTWASTSKMPIFNSNGRCIGTCGISRDITSGKEAEEALLFKTALLEAQAETTIDGILVVDESDRIVLTNKRFGIIFEIPGELLDTQDDRIVLRYVIDKVESPHAFIDRIDYLYGHPDETSRDEVRFKNGRIFDRYSAPLIDSTGRYRGRVWYFRDITERQRAEDRLRQLSMAVEQSPASVVITDLDGQITYINRKFTEVSGYSAEELAGKNPRILKSGHFSPDDYRQMWETITAGEEWRGVFHNRKKNGELYWESAVIRPIADHTGSVTHFLGLKEDITEKLALEGQLRQSQKLEAIGQLAAGIAHEINTPIQYVGDNTTFLKESWSQIAAFLNAAQKLRTAVHPGSVPQETVDNFDRLDQGGYIDYVVGEFPRAIDQTLEGVQRVAKIVGAMKEYSHPGSKEKRAIDLNRAIENTVTIARNEWKYVAEVRTQLDPDLPKVPCLAGEMNQVLLNLLVNAAQAIADVPRPGGGPGRIALSTRRDGDFVEIRVADTGTGIPEHVRERVFDPFFTTKEVGKGTGQGLMLAHTVVVNQHGGRIWFESEMGKGTTFFIRLPLA